MAKFNLAETLDLRPVSKLDTKAEMVELRLIEPHPNNFFKVEEDITELAESISLHGLLQPLVITPIEGGRYRLIAGHRRRKALLKLAESEPEKYRFVSCTVQPPMSPELEMLALIHTNTEAREIDSITRAKAAQAAEAALVKLVKEQGVELPGKMRAHIAKIIKSSEAQIARANYIAKHVIDPLLVPGISDNALYKLAHLPEEQQRELYEHYRNNVFRIDVQAIAAYVGNLAAGRAPFCAQKQSERIRDCYYQRYTSGKSPKCTHSQEIKQHKAEVNAEAVIETTMQYCHGDCCMYCNNRFFCADACPHCKKNIAEVKATYTYACNRRLHLARKAAKISDKSEASRMKTTIIALIARETVTELTATDLADRCRAYGCTPNQILGFEDMFGGGEEP